MERNSVNKKFKKNSYYGKYKKDKNKRIFSSFDEFDNRPFIPSKYYKEKQKFEKMLLDYEKFFKKHFGKSEIKVINPEFNQELLKKIQQDNMLFLKNNKFNEFPEKDFFAELVQNSNLDEDEDKETNLGKNQNNQDDYNSRKERIVDEWQRRKVSAKKIQDIFKEKRTHERIFVGFDKCKTAVVRVYVDEYDENKKIKSLKFYAYFLNDKRLIPVKKEIKQILHKNSISKEDAIKKIDYILEKALLLRDDSIRSDVLSEIYREKDKVKNNNFDKRTKYEEEKR